MDIKPSGERRAEEELFVAKVDRIMAEESVILEGLKAAVQAGRITEDEKSLWLEAYVNARLTPDQHTQAKSIMPDLSSIPSRDDYKQS